MKKVIAFTVGLMLLTSFAFAQGQAPAATNASMPEKAKAAGETLMLKGDIIDNMCAGSQSAESLSSFVKTHTKSCALSPSCVESGYSIFADGKLMKFDKASNAKIVEFLKNETNKLQVVVEAKKVGDELSLISIKNQE